MTPLQTKKLLEVAIAMAPALREAGITSASAGGLCFDVGRLPVKDMPELLEQDDHGEAKSPMDDPDLYGRRDGYVPGFSKLRERGRGEE